MPALETLPRRSPHVLFNGHLSNEDIKSAEDFWRSNRYSAKEESGDALAVRVTE